MAKKSIAAIVLTISLLVLSGCCGNEVTQVVTDNKAETAEALVHYMSCLGFSDSASRKAVSAAATPAITPKRAAPIALINSGKLCSQPLMLGKLCRAVGKGGLNARRNRKSELGN